ncbi:VirK/YbjX family protein [Biostraticola tofi]|uniref:DUF535 domain-containing protein n=1 Tax=Biostraticola tofi TaxID=466109 RepID=A0A4R3YZX7_9GAMM|nr:VirK/YbjX family protein [Biostraticola tofi]TCV98122.1 hypothetical protein EDC52_103208 [Biostraticola tofi]
MSHIISSLVPAPAINGWQLALALAKGKCSPGIAWQGRLYRWRFFIRHFLTLRYSGAWLDHLARHPMLPSILAAQPGLPCKMHRPYLAVSMAREDQLSALVYHYDNFIRGLPPAVINAHLHHAGARLLELEGKNNKRYAINLISMDKFNREGEVTLRLMNDENIMLAQITFIMTPQAGGTLFIGGLQGAPSGVPHEAIHEATKACHGLFPKRLVVEALTELGRHLGVRQILCVSNRHHMYRCWRYFYKKKHLFHADYDGFWASLNGTLQDSGYYSLPLSISRKPIESLASKKRAEYRRRYGLLDDLSQQLAQSLAYPNRSVLR